MKTNNRVQFVFDGECTFITKDGKELASFTGATLSSVKLELILEQLGFEVEEIFQDDLDAETEKY